MPEEDVAEVSGIAKKEGVWVVSDEIYSRLVYSAAGAPSPFRKHSSHRTILVDGFSKTFSMTGCAHHHSFIRSFIQCAPVVCEGVYLHRVDCTGGG